MKMKLRLDAQRAARLQLLFTFEDLKGILDT